jgi:hypothetical protein
MSNSFEDLDATNATLNTVRNLDERYLRYFFKILFVLIEVRPSSREDRIKIFRVTWYPCDLNTWPNDNNC